MPECLQYSVGVLGSNPGQDLGGGDSPLINKSQKFHRLKNLNKLLQLQENFPFDTAFRIGCSSNFYATFLLTSFSLFLQNIRP